MQLSWKTSFDGGASLVQTDDELCCLRWICKDLPCALGMCAVCFSLRCLATVRQHKLLEQGEAATEARERFSES